MKRILVPMIAILPFAAHAGGHGTFYDCSASGMKDMAIEVAASDCMIDGAKGKLAGKDPMTCQVSAGTMMMSSDQSFTWEDSGGKKFAGSCNKR